MRRTVDGLQFDMQGVKKEQMDTSIKVRRLQVSCAICWLPQTSFYLFLKHVATRLSTFTEVIPQIIADGTS